MDIPDLSTLQRNNVNFTIAGKTYKIPGDKLDELEYKFENMTEEELITEIRKIAIIDNIETNSDNIKTTS